MAACHCSNVTTSTAWPSMVTALSDILVVTGAMATCTGPLPWARLVTTVWYMLTGIWTRPAETKQSISATGCRLLGLAQRLAAGWAHSNLFPHPTYNVSKRLSGRRGLEKLWKPGSRQATAPCCASVLADTVQKDRPGRCAGLMPQGSSVWLSQVLPLRPLQPGLQFSQLPLATSRLQSPAYASS